jgi:hypothetical protein
LHENAVHALAVEMLVVRNGNPLLGLLVEIFRVVVTILRSLEAEFD